MASINLFLLMPDVSKISFTLIFSHTQEHSFLK
jgi:hypothetical protein